MRIYSLHLHENFAYLLTVWSFFSKMARDGEEKRNGFCLKTYKKEEIAMYHVYMYIFLDNQRKWHGFCLI